MQPPFGIIALPLWKSNECAGSRDTGKGAKPKGELLVLSPHPGMLRSNAGRSRPQVNPARRALPARSAFTALADQASSLSSRRMVYLEVSGARTRLLGHLLEAEGAEAR